MFIHAGESRAPSHGAVCLKVGRTKLVLAVAIRFLEANQFFSGAVPLVPLVGIDGDPLVAPPAFLQAVLAHQFVSLHVCPDRRVLAVGKPAVDGKVQGINGLLCHKATDPVIIEISMVVSIHH